MSVPNLPGLAKAKEPKSMPATKPAAKPEAGKKDPEGKGPCVCMCMCILFFLCHGTGAAQKPKSEEKRAGHGQNFSACECFLCHCIGSPPTADQQAEKKPRGQFAAMTYDTIYCILHCARNGSWIRRRQRGRPWPEVLNFRLCST